ncbi:adenosylcobinamide-GDP ribazoletransferase [Blastococcus jejuensis]|uniref:Adenosylcobinamide-GDP ribazoletransferase n=1 Tax=Blastococcus jejuensis TaxID=351224 RepID=A0ABP6P1P7_9ACTN
MRWTGPLESAALLTVLPVPARAAASTRGVLPWAPLIGLGLGGIAAGVALAGSRWVSPGTGAVLAVGVLALLTRGLHLDGLADTADGLGPLRGRERALEVMRRGDVGPFGVITLVLVLLLQVTCLATLLAGEDGWLPLWAAVVTSRLAMARAGLPGMAVAEGSSLGRAVAGTVSRRWLLGCALAAVALLAPATGADPARAGALAGAAAVGLLAAEVVSRRGRRRLGGVNGDVMGAMGETATAAALLAAAALWP